MKTAFREFTSTEDGQIFIQRLEGIPNDIISMLPDDIMPSKVGCMLVIIRVGGRATVYTNELELRLVVRPTRRVQIGAPVMTDDIAEVERPELGLTIPPDAAFLFLFSIGWRKGLFYDYGPILPHGAQLRKYDVPDALGRAYCHVVFQSRFSITEKEWGDMFAAKWFPFSGLSDHLVEALIKSVYSSFTSCSFFSRTITTLQVLLWM